MKEAVLSHQAPYLSSDRICNVKLVLRKRTSKCFKVVSQNFPNQTFVFNTQVKREWIVVWFNQDPVNGRDPSVHIKVCLLGFG